MIDFARELRCLKLYVRGYTIGEIAKEMTEARDPLSMKRWRRRVRQAIKSALRKNTSQYEHVAKKAKKMDLLRLHKLLRFAWGKAVKGNTRAVNAVLRIIERRSKMLGNEAPVKWKGESDINHTGLLGLAEKLEKEQRLPTRQALIDRAKNEIDKN